MTDPTSWSADALLAGIQSPTDWRRIPPSEVRTAWRDLREWVEWLRDRYTLDYRVVPPCWYRHSALVDVLVALRDHHQYAFSDLQPASAATEWQRVFRDLEPRLREWASRAGCTRDTHRPDITMPCPDDTPVWQQHLADDELRRIARDQAQPLD
jgi:hypothetical protein